MNGKPASYATGARRPARSYARDGPGVGPAAFLTDQPELINSAGHGGEQCVCDLTEDLESRQSLLSFHLRTLKGAGLVTDRRDGGGSTTINPDGLEALRRALDELRPSSHGLRVLRRCD